MQEYSVYIIHSSKYDIHYIGHTNSLSDRLIRHNQNRNNFTKNKEPWELVISFHCNTKSEAFRLELKLKAFKNSKLAINYLSNLVQSTPI